MDNPPKTRPMQDLGEALGYRGSTVVVVGCSTGIGEATARLLGGLGARVHAVGVHEPPVAVEGFHATDLASPERVEATTAALASVGPIHSLFCCSGVPATCPPLDIGRVNYVGLRQLVDLTLPSIADGGGVAVVSSNVAAGWLRRLPELADIIGLSDAGAAMRWFEDHPDVVADGYRLAKHLLCAWVAGIAPAMGFERVSGSTALRRVPRRRRSAIGPPPWWAPLSSTSSPIRSWEDLHSPGAGVAIGAAEQPAQRGRDRHHPLHRPGRR